ncbi:hypothetical protein Desor_3369 [Desulfosporosinus orientis DSM 765]|uniref:Uncharacterized protein n=1 Tax=Desulfosporosinus orientis (strain ATCC 19365 / DSM 765 / NCIMB 8382 / VKM B-1628 / Singapore I) TaxID=768706 RepID=G7WDW0_DESOD|nr:hypothetical protein [Desulfosporosinus orientis]AET68867.1 hypothetical protein Desor_3369 [Desulfosporosinus orientis DSM 765]
MNTYRPSQSSNYWMFALKFLILILGLYLSAVILSKVFSLVFAVTFFLIRILVLIGASFIVLHFFLKLLFRIDLVQTSKQFIQR